MQVLLPGSDLLRSHLSHILHFLAFSIFSEEAPNSAAAAAAARVDLSVTLPSRVVLCSHLVSIAKCVCVCLCDQEHVNVCACLGRLPWRASLCSHLVWVSDVYANVKACVCGCLGGNHFAATWFACETCVILRPGVWLPPKGFTLKPPGLHAKHMCDKHKRI